MNSRLGRTAPYPFERLRSLLENVPPADRAPLKLTIGEPQGAPSPKAMAALLEDPVSDVGRYPLTRGSKELRVAAAGWFGQRFNTPIDPDRQILPVNGTREALFAIAQTLVDTQTRNPRVIVPNPFYQIYEGAALLAGAQPYYWSSDDPHGLPDIDALETSLLRQCQLLYICSPANPNGAVAQLSWYQRLLELAEKYDFVVVADECYSEIFKDEPPCSLLQASAALGNQEFSRCLVFHSLSKRSNLPGLRSGFIAGNADLLEAFAHYRTYHGSAMSPLVQRASTAAWSDDDHAARNRASYQRKFAMVTEALGDVWDIRWPAGGFYLWAETPMGGEQLVRALYEQQNVTLLPGSYLARDDANGQNPGEHFVRISLVLSSDEISQLCERLIEFANTNEKAYFRR